jgi:hypothetical protein
LFHSKKEILLVIYWFSFDMYLNCLVSTSNLFSLKYRKLLQTVMGKLHIQNGGIMMTLMNIFGLFLLIYMYFLDCCVHFKVSLWYFVLFAMFM